MAPTEVCRIAKSLAEQRGTQADRRQWASTLAELLESLACSTVGELDLEPESAVRDFMTDRLIQDVVLGQQVESALRGFVSDSCVFAGARCRCRAPAA